MHGLQRALDEEILARAAREQRILISADMDFGFLLASRRDPRPLIRGSLRQLAWGRALVTRQSVQMFFDSLGTAAEPPEHDIARAEVEDRELMESLSAWPRIPLRRRNRALPAVVSPTTGRLVVGRALVHAADLMQAQPGVALDSTKSTKYTESTMKEQPWRS